MSKKILSAVFALSMFAIANSAYAATFYVDSAAPGPLYDGSQADPFQTIEAGVAAAVTAGDLVEITGSFVNVAAINITNDITLNGNSGATISTSGTNNVFLITGTGATIQNLALTKTDNGGVQNMIAIQANDVSIINNDFLGQWNIGDGDVVRGLAISPGVTNFLLDQNTFNHLRQPAYIDASTGTITNNYVSDTKGFVIASNASITITGNSFGTNVGDIAIICGTPVASNATCPDADNFTDTVALSNANDGAVVDKQVPVKDDATFSVVYVDDSAAPGGNGTEATPLQTIAAAIAKVATGGTIIVAAGTYTENLTINKSLSLTGPNLNISAVTGTRNPEATLTGVILVTASDVTINGMDITNPAYSGNSIKGIQLYSSGPTISNIDILNNRITDVNNGNTKGAYGVMVQADVNDVRIEGNKIDSISSPGWARGIEITAGCNVTAVPGAVVIKDNQVTNISDTSGTDAYDISIDWCDSPVQIADASQVTLEDNIFDGVSLKNLDTVHPLNVTKNYWGTTTPDFSTATGSVTTDPWCLDSACGSLYVAPAPTPSGGGGGGGSIVIPAASYSNGGTSPSAPVPGINAGQVLGASTYNFTTNLRYGSRGEAVSELQKVLIAQGYLVLKTGLPTGWFGPMTRAALIKWQRANGIPATGFFGPLSRAKMNL